MHTSIKRHTALGLLACTAIAAPAVALASPLAQAGPSATARARSASGHTVVLKGLRFHPSTITIKRGESVTWVWRDGDIDHNVTGGSFHSRTTDRGSFTVRFTHRGTFSYRCTIHAAAGMFGKVVVR